MIIIIDYYFMYEGNSVLKFVAFTNSTKFVTFDLQFLIRDK